MFFAIVPELVCEMHFRMIAYSYLKNPLSFGFGSEIGEVKPKTYKCLNILFVVIVFWYILRCQIGKD
jgi:hypothetical protein